MRTKLLKLLCAFSALLFALPIISKAQAFTSAQYADGTVLRYLLSKPQLDDFDWLTARCLEALYAKQLSTIKETLKPVTDSANNLGFEIFQATDEQFEYRAEELMNTPDSSIRQIVRDTHMYMVSSGKPAEFRQKHAKAIHEAADVFMGQKKVNQPLIDEYNNTVEEENSLKALCAKNGFTCE